jgi:hypothetical protein
MATVLPSFPVPIVPPELVGQILRNLVPTTEENVDGLLKCMQVSHLFRDIARKVSWSIVRLYRTHELVDGPSRRHTVSEFRDIILNKSTEIAPYIHHLVLSECLFGCTPEVMLNIIRHTINLHSLAIEIRLIDEQRRNKLRESFFQDLSRAIQGGGIREHVPIQWSFVATEGNMDSFWRVQSAVQGRITSLSLMKTDIANGEVWTALFWDIVKASKATLKELSLSMNPGII